MTECKWCKGRGTVCVQVAGDLYENRVCSCKNQTTGHTDYFGTPIKVGSKVAYLSHSRTSGSLNSGICTGSTNCYVKVRAQGDCEDTKVSPEKVVVNPHD